MKTLLRNIALATALSAAFGAHAQTVTGGSLFAASQAPIGATLLSTGGLSSYTVTLYWDSVFGIPTNNPQDKFGSSVLFTSTMPGTTSTTVTLTPPAPDLIPGQSVSASFPKGIPLMLAGFAPDASAGRPVTSTTADIGKDIGGVRLASAQVTYGTNSTAVVSFPSGGGNFGLSVRLTNVSSSTGGGGLGGGGCK